MSKSPDAGPAGARATLATPAANARKGAVQARRVPMAPARSSGATQPGFRAKISATTVGSFLPRLTRPAFERYGFSAAALITDWATIVGADIAAYTRPERLKWPRRVDWSGDEVADTERGRPGATLVLAVAQGRALDIEYKTSQLVERINAYFGYRAVSDLRIMQVASIRPAGSRPQVSQASALAASTPHAPAPTPRIELAAIAEPGLRAALERMAQGLVTRRTRGSPRT
ncbi:MAG: DUF721 domain-containing protein [Hyphomicrobiaceae bacterium]